MVVKKAGFRRTGGIFSSYSWFGGTEFALRIIEISSLLCRFISFWRKWIPPHGGPCSTPVRKPTTTGGCCQPRYCIVLWLARWYHCFPKNCVLAALNHLDGKTPYPLYSILSLLPRSVKRGASLSSFSLLVRGLDLNTKGISYFVSESLSVDFYYIRHWMWMMRFVNQIDFHQHRSI
jgi:hypothetical protein